MLVCNNEQNLSVKLLIHEDLQWRHEIMAISLKLQTSRAVFGRSETQDLYPRALQCINARFGFEMTKGKQCWLQRSHWNVAACDAAHATWSVVLHNADRLLSGGDKM